MPLSLYRRPSGIWHIRGTYKGCVVDQSSGTRTKALADDERAAIEARILKESIHGRAAVIGFGEAALAYMKATGQTRFMARVIEHFKDKPIARIGLEDIEDAAERLFPDASPSTRRRQVHVPVNAVINHARGKRPRPRPAEVRRTRWLTVEEAEELIRHGGRMAALITFFLNTGVRASEALRLDWKDVDLESCRAWIWQSKQSTARWAAFGARTRAALASLPHREGPVFLTPKGQPYRIPQGESGGNPIKRGFDRARIAAGLGEDVTPHTLRHTWATWAYAVDSDPYRIGEYGGWSTGEMPRRYVKLAPRGYGAVITAAGWEMFGPEAGAEAGTGTQAGTQAGPEQDANALPGYFPETSNHSRHVPQTSVKTKRSF